MSYSSCGCSSCGHQRCCCKKTPSVTSNNGRFTFGIGTPPNSIIYTIPAGGDLPIDIAQINGKGIVFASGSTEIGLQANSQYLIVFSVTGTPVFADGGLAVAPQLNGFPTAGVAFQGAAAGNGGQVSATGTTIINTSNGRNIFTLVNSNTAAVGYSVLRLTITQIG